MNKTVKKSWGARLLSLLLQGLAVLGGVLLAFAVDSYGQRHDNRQRVYRMLTALNAELEVNADRLDGLIQDDEQELSDIDSIFAAVVVPEAGITPSVEDVTGAIYSIGPTVIRPYQTGALDDLLLNGGLTLVENEHIRRAILDYSQLLSREMAAQDNGVSFWDEHLSPYYFEYGSLGQFLLADRLGLTAPSPVSDAFVRSRQFANLLGERRAIASRRRTARLAVMARIDSVRPLLP